MRTLIVVAGMIAGCAASSRTKVSSPTSFARPPAASWRHGAIYGVVTNLSRGEPLAGVTVTVTSPTLDGQAQSAFTDEHGAFSIDEVPAGEYLVTFFYLDLASKQRALVHVHEPTRVTKVIDESKASKSEPIEVLRSDCHLGATERSPNRIGGETCSMDCRQPVGICADLCWWHRR